MSKEKEGGGEEEEEVEIESLSESTDEYDQVERILETVKEIKYNEKLQKQIECEESEHEGLSEKLERMRSLYHAIIDIWQKLIQKQKQIETDTNAATEKRDIDLRACAAKLQAFKSQKYCEEVNLRQELSERVTRNETLKQTLKLMGIQGLDQKKYNHYQKFVTDEVGQYCQEALQLIKKQELGAKQIFEFYEKIEEEHVKGTNAKKPRIIRSSSEHFVPDEKEAMKKVMGYFDEQMKKRKQLLGVIEENDKVIQHYKTILHNILVKPPGGGTVVCRKEKPVKRVQPEERMKMVLKREYEFRCLKNEIHALEMKLIRLEQIEDHALDIMEDMKQEKENEDRNRTMYE